MTVSLFIPGKQPNVFKADTLFGHVTGGRIVPRLHKAAELLGVRPSLVDVVGIGHGYVVLAIFDHTGQLNEAGTKELTRLSGIELDLSDEGDALYGPVLTLTLED